MKILVIGANGGIGRQAVEQALATGHNTTAMVRNLANLTLTHPLLQTVQGDVMQQDTVEKYVRGQDAVISALGVKGGFFGDKPTTLYSQGNAHLIEAMKKTGVRRAFFISASAIEVSPVMPFWARFAARYIVSNLLRYMYADLREMERIIHASNIDYTIIRPPRLTNKSATGHYRFSINSFLKNSLSISRADVAHFMIHHLEDSATYKSMVEIGY
ncbi:MAG TPA: SDR family oxidoreductase [Puia sp.]|nr:SDR family oxidoreductase [Puia sp.]